MLRFWRDASKSAGTPVFESLLEPRIRGKIKSQNSCRKETLSLPLPEVPLRFLSHAAFHHHLQTRIVVLKSLLNTQLGYTVRRDYGRAGWGPVSSGPYSPPLSLQAGFSPTFHLPRWACVPSPFIFRLQKHPHELFVPMLQVCTLARADAFSPLQPANSFVFQIFPHYLTPQRHDLAPRCYRLLHLFAFITLFAYPCHIIILHRVLQPRNVWIQ